MFKNIDKSILIANIFSKMSYIMLLFIFIFQSENKIVIPTMIIILLLSYVCIAIVSFLLRNQNYKNKIIYSTVIYIVLSSLIYLFPYNIYGLFINQTAILNYTVYASKIIFICTPIIGFCIYSKYSFIVKFKTISFKTLLFMLLDTLLFIAFLIVLHKPYSTTSLIWCIPIIKLLETIVNIICKKILKN